MASSKPDGDKQQKSAAPAGRCPICTAPTELAFRPFCSRRCADVDLSRWLRGAYAIAGRTDTDEDGDDTAAASGTYRRSSAGDDRDDGGSNGSENDDGNDRR